MHLAVAAWCALVAGLLGCFVPRLVAVLPEPPAAQAPDDPVDAAEHVEDDAPPKVPYAVLAAAPGAAWKAGLAAALAGAVAGGALGADWALLFLLYLCPIGVALAWVDWRLRLLPVALVRPSYVVLVLLVVAAGLAAGEPRRLLGALAGLVVLRGLYWLLWKFTPGMGYGDVRLAGLIGMALGYLGAAALLVGGYAGFVIGAVCWVPMRLLGITKDTHFPFGPFMLIGVLAGVVWQAALA